MNDGSDRAGGAGTHGGDDGPLRADRPFRLRGVFSVLPTAFDDDGTLDLAGVEALVTAHVEAGVAGLTALGVMGEAAELEEHERTTVLTTIVRAARSVPVVVGISGDSKRVVSERAAGAGSLGASAVMVSPSRSVALPEAVAAAAESGLPIVIQDYLAGSGVAVTDRDLVAVASAQPRVVGVKAETPPTSDRIASLRRLAPTLDVVGGLGGLFLIDELRAGAPGVMTGFAMPGRLVSIVRSFASDPVSAEDDWSRLLPLMRLEAFAPFSLGARKEVWHLRGVLRSAHCRRVGATLGPTARADVLRALELVGG